MSTAAEQWLATGEWAGVTSSNVGSIRYDIGTATLSIRYLGGSTYEYYDVPPEVAAGLHDAPSKGRFRHQYLGRGSYAYKQVR